ncbi:MAG: hypothetical protein WCK35_01305 [Chloroflexota bacterium]
MKKQANLALVGLIYLILLTVYNLLIFTIFDVKTNVFWVSYGFMTLAFFVQLTSLLLALRKTNVETIFWGIPLVSLSIYYILAELGISLVFMIFQNAGFIPAMVIQTIFLAAFVIITIIALMAREAVSDVTAVIRENVHNQKLINVDIDLLMQKSTNPELKAALRKLSETIKYSDPITNSSVADVDQRILSKVNETRIYCENDQIKEAKGCCSELELLYMERNRKLMISK